MKQLSFTTRLDMVSQSCGVSREQVEACLEYKRGPKTTPREDRYHSHVWSVWIGYLLAEAIGGDADPIAEATRYLRSGYSREGSTIRREIADGIVPQIWIVRGAIAKDMVSPATQGESSVTSDVAEHAVDSTVAPVVEALQCQGQESSPLAGEPSNATPVSDMTGDMASSPVEQLSLNVLEAEQRVQTVAPVVEALQSKGLAGGVTHTDRERHQPAVDSSGLRYWSPSAVSLFLQCGIAWEYQYLIKPPRRTSPSRIQGTVAHRGIEALCRAKIDGAEWDSESLALVMMDKLTEEWRGDVILDDDERAMGEAAVKERLVRRATLAVAAFRDEVLPQVSPIDAEVRFRFPTSHNFGLSGVIDMIAPGRLYDWKVSGKKKTQRDADSTLQFSAYYLAYRHMYQQYPDGATMGSIVVTPKTDKSYCDQIHTTRSREDLSRFLRTVAACQRLVDAGAFHPADPTSFKCCEDYCDYWPLCVYGAKGRTQR